jgi:hypothetical protein
MKIPARLFLIGILSIVLVLTACSGKTDNSVTTAGPSATTSPDFRAYTDPATQNAMQGLSENNYEKYTRDFSPAMQAATTLAAIEKISAQIKTQFGNFVELKYLSTENQPQYLIVHYSAKYEKGELKIKMVFDQNQKIAGQWFE